MEVNRTFLITIFLLATSCANAFAQLALRENPQPMSPQAAEMTRYGTHNVNLYTGRIGVNIPIGVYKDADFELPVSLSYNYNGFRVNEQPSEAGLGWSVSCGGVITREVRGIPDEERGSLKIFAGGEEREILTYSYDALTAIPNGGPEDDVYVQILTGDISKEGAINTFFQVGNNYYDAQPDVYHFSFLGHSGSFVRRTDGSFMVFDTGGDILYKVEKANQDDGTGTDTILSEICITTGDGYKYLFGYGVTTGNTKRHCDRMTLGKEAMGLGRIVSWHLNSITSPGGRSLYFDYEGPSSVRSFSGPFWMPSSTGFYNGAVLPGNTYTDTFLLSEVSNENEEVISFYYETKNEDQSGLFINGESADNVLNPSNATSLLKEIYCAGDTASLYFKWNQQGNPYPFLERVTIGSVGSYLMEYEDVDERYFPHYGSQAHDHWGYLNSTYEAAARSNYVNWSSVSTTNSDYEETLGSFCAPAFNASCLGMMKKITYPTGGWSEFTYEANSYTKAVRKTLDNNYNLSDDAVTGTGPGGRIKTIVNKDSDGTVKNSYSYSYTGLNGKPSGRLLAYPRHKMSYGGWFGNDVLTVFYAMTGNIYRTGDVVVEYPCVTETCSDGSKVEYEFTDWSLYYDYLSAGYVMPLYRIYNSVMAHMNNVHDRWNVQRILTPPTKYEALRGKPLRQKYYAANQSTPLKTVQNSYDYTDESYYEFLNVGDDCSRIIHLAINPYVATTSEVWHYGAGDVQSSVSRTYNAFNQLTSETTTRSDGTTLRTLYTYPSDYPSDSVLVHMARAGVNGYPVTVTVQEKPTGTNTWTTQSATRYTFAELVNSFGPGADGNKMYLPVTIEQKDLVSGAWKTTQTRTYDSYGNVSQSVDANGIATAYVWSVYGYGPTQITQNAGQSDARTWTIQYFRPGLPSSITGPDGITKTWTYDDAGRLTAEAESGIGKIFDMVYSTKTYLR